MREEITKAVDVFHKIAFKNSEAKKSISDSQFAAFITILQELLLVRYEKFWFPDEPERASAYRCLRVNGQSFDPVVSESLKRVGIPPHKHKKLIFNDVTVWVDPGVVSMRIGEDGSIGHEIVDEELYARNMAKRTASPQLPKVKEVAAESDVDEGIGSRSPSPPDSPTSDMSNPRRAPPPSSLQQEYNPYNMSSRVCNARQRGGVAPPPHHQTMSPQRTMTPPPATTTNMFVHPSSAQRSSRPIMPQGPPNMNTPPPQASMYHNGHIPVSASGSSSIFPSARRSVFADNAGMQVPSHFQMGYHAGSYMDIPVVA